MSVNIKKGIKEMSEKLGKPEATLMEEMAKLKADLELIFDDADEVEQAAFKQLRGAYRAQMKSSAKLFEGFFFAMQPVRNENDYVLKEATKDFNKLVDEVGQEEAVQQWIAQGKMNENEEFLFNSDNTTEAMKWKRGKVIERNVPIRDLYGFFKEAEGEGKIRFGILTMRHDPEEFVPEILKVYRFRAGGKTENVPLRLNGTGVTSLTEVGVDVDFDVFVKMVSQEMPKNVKSFDEVYDCERGVCKVPESPKFFVTKASISRFTVTEKADINVDFVEITDLVGDFEPVSMSVGKESSVKLYENAIGIAVYAPYIRRKDQTAAGNLWGFVMKGGDAAPKTEAINPPKKEKKEKKPAGKSDESWT
jgi:hypothetical protein